MNPSGRPSHLPATCVVMFVAGVTGGLIGGGGPTFIGVLVGLVGTTALCLGAVLLIQGSAIEGIDLFFGGVILAFLLLGGLLLAGAGFLLAESAPGARRSVPGATRGRRAFGRRKSAVSGGQQVLAPVGMRFEFCSITEPDRARGPIAASLRIAAVRASRHPDLDVDPEAEMAHRALMQRLLAKVRH